MSREAELIAEIQTGNIQAEEEFVHRYRRGILMILRGHTQSQERPKICARTHSALHLVACAAVKLSIPTVFPDSFAGSHVILRSTMHGMRHDGKQPQMTMNCIHYRLSPRRRNWMSCSERSRFVQFVMCSRSYPGIGTGSCFTGSTLPRRIRRPSAATLV